MSIKLTRRGFSGGMAATVAAAGLPRQADAAVTFKYANASNEQNLSNQFAAMFLKEVEKRTNGEVKTQILYNMGGEKSILEGVSLGTLDMAVVGYSGLREFDVFYTPYLLRDIPHGVEVMKGPIGERAAKAMKDRYDVRLVGVGSTGPFLLGIKEPAGSWADLKDRKIRVPQFEAYLEAIAALDARPTPIPFNEVYLALQQGVVEGLVTILNVMLANKFVEVCKYVVANDFGVGLDKFVVSERSWSRMTPAQQQIFQDTYDEMMPTHFVQRAIDQASLDFKKWEELNGDGTVLRLDAEQLQRTMEPVGRKLADDVYGPGAYDLFQA